MADWSACAFGITFGPDGNLYVANNIGSIQKFDGKTGSNRTPPCKTETKQRMSAGNVMVRYTFKST